LDEIANKEIATIYNDSQTENNTNALVDEIATIYNDSQTENNTIALDEIANKEIATIYNNSQTENTTENHIETTQKLGKKNNKNEKVF
jgi:uncharacterized Zn finger protein